MIDGKRSTDYAMGMIGQVVGNLTIKDIDKITSAGNVRFLCDCLCGTKDIKKWHSTLKKVNHCGCKSPPRKCSQNRMTCKDSPYHKIYQSFMAMNKTKDTGFDNFTLFVLWMESLVGRINVAHKYSFSKILKCQPYSRTNIKIKVKSGIKVIGTYTDIKQTPN